MPNNWHKAFDELKEYIAKCPDIEIGMNAICISADVRPEFYRLFNAVRAKLVEDNFPLFLEKGHLLSKNWVDISQSVMDELKLESIDVPDSIRWFLIDPSDGLVRTLYDPLFDVFKGKRDIVTFEQDAVKIVADEFPKLFREGYKFWAIMSIFNLLSIDKVYRVPIPEHNDPTMADMVDLKPGLHKETVPDPRATNKISFVYDNVCTFLVPIILHSTRLDLNTAFRSDFREARWTSRLPSTQQEWYSISDIVKDYGQSKLWPDLVIYANTDYKELNLIADHFQIARPDIMVEFREEKDWYEKEGLEVIKHHYNALKPRLGSFIVCRESVSESTIKMFAQELMGLPVAEGENIKTTAQPALNIQLLNVGYDKTKLEPIIEAIIKGQTKTGGVIDENATIS
jgi:hypothetical protein